MVKENPNKVNTKVFEKGPVDCIAVSTSFVLKPGHRLCDTNAACIVPSGRSKWSWLIQDKTLWESASHVLLSYFVTRFDILCLRKTIEWIIISPRYSVLEARQFDRDRYLYESSRSLLVKNFIFVMAPKRAVWLAQESNYKDFLWVYVNRLLCCLLVRCCCLSSHTQVLLKVLKSAAATEFDKFAAARFCMN